MNMYTITNKGAAMDSHAVLLRCIELATLSVGGRNSAQYVEIANEYADFVFNYQGLREKARKAAKATSGEVGAEC